MAKTRRYKSWSDLKKRMEALLCDSLKGRVEYFLTSYRKVHDEGGRAAIRIDGKEAIGFDWINMYRQYVDMSEAYRNDRSLFFDEARALNKPKWDKDCVYYEGDFAAAAQEFRQMKIADALNSPNSIIKIFAIFDARVGKRTLKRLAESNAQADYPDWVKPFYKLRLQAEGIIESAKPPA